MKLYFSKYHGAGNDFIMIDDRRSVFPADHSELIHFLCERHTGIGADGLMLLRGSKKYDFKMLYFNSDGKPGTMCGNGGRCMLAFARYIGQIQGAGPFRFEASDGPHNASFCENGLIRLRMINVDNIRKIHEGYRIDTGSIHHVEYVDKLVDIDVQERGRRLRFDPAYASDNGCNVDFIEFRDSGTIAIRTYERGVENETMACGTGAVAAAIAHHAQGYHRDSYRILARGGELGVSFKYADGVYKEVDLQGPATHVFDGELNI